MITRFEINQNDIFVNIQLDVQENYGEWLTGETAQKVMQDFTSRNITESEYIELPDTELSIWAESVLIKIAETSDVPLGEPLTMESRMTSQETTTAQIVDVLEGLIL